MKNQDITKVNVELNALCYAFGQAEDYIPVVYSEAEYDEQIHFKQVQQLAKVCCERYLNASRDEQDNCHQWDPRIISIAFCKTLEDYKKL